MEFDIAKISDLLQSLLMAVLPVLAYMATAYVKLQINNVKVSLDDSKREALENIITIAVFAAEQFYVSGEGEQKKQYALDVIQAWLDSTGIKIDATIIEAAIEKAVLENFPNFSLSDFDE